jgi:DNA-binding NarL/FixJ family response regulator
MRRADDPLVERVKCLVVDDDHYYREGLAEGLRRMDGVEVVGSAGSLIEAVGAAHDPDVVLLDLGLPSTCRRSVIAHIRQALPDAAILVVTGHATNPDVVQAFGEGARGYLTKGVQPAELATAIQTVAAGGTYLTPSLAGHLLDARLRLTTGERAVLRLVAEGQSDKEVAATLGIKLRTVENRIRLIRGKAELVHEPRSALTRFARECDPGCLLRPDEHDRPRPRRRATP